ncbi:hypothetical protein TWF594_002971 [Orbilia oligospora]|uniref:Uncharacterized protein n=1 Tax=Orbilia oligospora TaxID=2813651 RepID=A0A7C8JV89_ORBOL|nr:hypothetical protein TWF703_006555 [Orbilia oligospora]KAF3146910.1 hypothetical protein TWF594_002971 [Orbilia oligospora]
MADDGKKIIDKSGNELDGIMDQENIPPVRLNQPSQIGPLDAGVKSSGTKQSEQQFQEQLLMKERIKWPGLYENPMPHGRGL